MRAMEPGEASEFAAALAQSGVAAPLYGVEVSDGIPVDFVWRRCGSS